MTSIPTGIRRLDCPVLLDEYRPVTITADQDWPEGITIVGGPGFTTEANVDVDGPVLTFGFASDDIATVLGLPYRWRNAEGRTFVDGWCTTAVGTDDPGFDQVVSLNIEGESVAVTLAIAGGGAEVASTYTIPFVGQWNHELLAGEPYLFPAFMIGCRIADITPTPPSVSDSDPDRLVVQVLQHRIVGSPPAEPVGFDDIPTEWEIVQDNEEADIYGAVLLPMPFVDLDPEHPYPGSDPIWYRGRSVDADGFETNVYMYFPAGVAVIPDDVDVVVFADGVRTEHTIGAPPDDETAGPAEDMTVTFRAVGGTGAAALASNVDARLAALVARVEALEP